MRDLPPGLTTFNDACLAQQRAQPRQPALAANREHVRAIVAEAQRPAPGLLAYAGARPRAAGALRAPRGPRWPRQCGGRRVKMWCIVALLQV
jgi:hypothetical protein